MNDPIVVEETFNKSIEFVWTAITEIDQMKLWFFENIPAFEPIIGFETAFNVKSRERDFMHQWKIIEVVPKKKIVYDWRYKDYVGNATLTFELIEENNKTTIKVICEGIESFPQDIPEFKRESCLAGWNFFIKDRLKNYISIK